MTHWVSWKTTGFVFRSYYFIIKEASDSVASLIGSSARASCSRAIGSDPVCRSIFKGVKALRRRPGDTPEALQHRVMEEAEWQLLPQAAEMLSAEIVKERESV